MSLNAVTTSLIANINNFADEVEVFDTFMRV